mgnify:CR=1 FL=1
MARRARAVSSVILALLVALCGVNCAFAQECAVGCTSEKSAAARLRRLCECVDDAGLAKPPTGPGAFGIESTSRHAGVFLALLDAQQSVAIV